MKKNKGKLIAILGFTLLVAVLIGCSQDLTIEETSDNNVSIDTPTNTDVENKEQEGVIFPRGNKGPSQVFVGDVYVKMLVTDPEGTFDTQAYNVEFEPGARTFWHSHAGGQILLVTEGTGYYQEEGKPARKLEIGDVVEIPIGVKHWHGATPDSHFTHLGMTTQVEKGPAEWLGEVTDEQYNNLEVAPKDDTVENKEEGVIFPRGNKGPSQVFVGDVYVKMLVTDPEKAFDSQVYNVEFEPGARTFRHSHAGGQLLFVTEGIGYYQEEGKPARKLEVGDVVEIPIGVKHWHGAAPDSHFTHIGITTQVEKGPAEWLGKLQMMIMPTLSDNN